MIDWSKIEMSHNPPIIGQYDDGTWYWLDETWNYGDDVHYATRGEARAALDIYCAYLEEGDEGVREHMHRMVDEHHAHIKQARACGERLITWFEWERGVRP